MPKFNSYIYPTPAAPIERQTKTTEPLSGHEEWISVIFDTTSFSLIEGSIFTDQAGKIYIEQSHNQDDWDISTEFTIAVAEGRGFVETLLLPYARVRYKNGGTDQTVLRLYFNFT